MASLSNEFRAVVSAGGLRAGMRWLNARVPYRYSAIFAFHGDTLRNVCLVDKENQSITRCDDQPITESYCLYIHRSGERFAVEEARADPRVDGHPKRYVCQCYYGIPLHGANGKLLGTVCHFDPLPRNLTAGIAETLDELAPFIAKEAFPDEPGL